MAKSKSTRTSAPAQAPAEPDAFDLRNELDARLLEARSTLDLLNSLVSSRDCAGVHLESLFADTLPTVTDDAIRKIDAAIELLDALVQALQPQRDAA